MKPDLESLNAYVDGELSKDAATSVARAIANDPAVARKVVALTDLRSALADSIDAPDIRIDDLFPISDAGARRRGTGSRHHKWLAIAACLAGLLLIGTFGYRNTAGRMSETWITPVLAVHDIWSLESANALATPIQPINFLSNELARLVYVPDLTSAKLQMVYVNPEHRVGSANFFVAGYAGTRGCKITLVAQIAEGVLDENPRDIGITKLRALAWNAGPLDYILMSQGMDNDRFELIAATVHESSINHHPVNSQTRVALGLSRELSAPCAA
ncbi:MAG: hypothetical protein HQ501_10310 [Rhodospirillales bacterium]|nr:hypothetical protein [Rhodospirillales bacterium]